MTRRRNDGPPLPAALVLNTMPASPCGTTTGSSFAYVYFENNPDRAQFLKIRTRNLFRCVQDLAVAFYCRATFALRNGRATKSLYSIGRLAMTLRRRPRQAPVTHSPSPSPDEWPGRHLAPRAQMFARGCILFSKRKTLMLLSWFR